MTCIAFCPQYNTGQLPPDHFNITKVSVGKSKPWIFFNPLTNASNSWSVTFSMTFTVALSSFLAYLIVYYLRYSRTSQVHVLTVYTFRKRGNVPTNEPTDFFSFSARLFRYGVWRLWEWIEIYQRHSGWSRQDQLYILLLRSMWYRVETTKAQGMNARILKYI